MWVKVRVRTRVWVKVRGRGRFRVRACLSGYCRCEGGSYGADCSLYLPTPPHLSPYLRLLQV